jgi:hypothetical protein
MKFRVYIMESERGWGQRVEEVRMFDTYEEAAELVTEYNSCNNEDVVPDWYMYATDPQRVIE